MTRWPAAGLTENGAQRPGYAPACVRPGGVARPRPAQRGEAGPPAARPSFQRCGPPPERARAILRAVAADRLEAGYALAFLGLRSSEILGIARSDVDLEHLALTVRYQIAGSGRKAARVPTKTAASAATIPLPMFVVERLVAHLDRLADERPVVPFGDFLVFVTQKGLPINGSWFTKHFRHFCWKPACPRCDFMTCATARQVCSSTPEPIREWLKSCSGTLPEARSPWSDTRTSRRPNSGKPRTCLTGRWQAVMRNQSPNQSRALRKQSSGVVRKKPKWSIHSGRLAPAVGLEPTT